MSDRSVRIDDGGPAFPQIKSAITAFDEDGVPLGSGITGFDRGMCLRDWFAGMAMQGIVEGDHTGEGGGLWLDSPEPAFKGGTHTRSQLRADMLTQTAADAYAYADAMLAARKAGGK
jgi:hypothetical protein